jgi:hypothetical protein
LQNRSRPSEGTTVICWFYNTTPRRRKPVRLKPRHLLPVYDDLHFSERQMALLLGASVHSIRRLRALLRNRRFLWRGAA